MPAYEIQSLTKSFGPTTALSSLTFTARHGEFLVILGPTGSGKTTLLRTLAGLESPTSGTITEISTLPPQSSVNITSLPPAQRDIAMVFQNFSLYPRLSVYNNLAFPLRPTWRKIPPQEIDRRVKWAADLLGLTPKLHALPTTLSGGQQQRVAIGRAIVREPKLFLFDEPLASLDAKLRESMAVEIHRLQRKLNTTMLYVTHDQTEAMSLADRILVLDQGRILQTGTPDEIYSQPNSPRVARMLGTPPINLLQAALKNNTYHIAGTCLQLPVSPTPSASLSPHSFVLGLRPEHIELTPTHVPSPTTASIKVIEHLGPITTTLLTLPPINTNAAPIELRATLPPTTALQPGDLVHLYISPHNILTW